MICLRVLYGTQQTDGPVLSVPIPAPNGTDGTFPCATSSQNRVPRTTALTGALCDSMD